MPEEINKQETESGSPAPEPGFPPLPRPFIVSVFIGPDGLRPGWRVVLYFAMFFLLSVGLGAFIPLRNLKPLPLIWRLLADECIRLISAVVPALIMAGIEHRQWKVYGLPPAKAFGKLFWVGAVWGLAGLTLLLLLMRSARVFYFGHPVLHGPRVIKFALFYAGLFLIVALFEEFCFRGYSLFTLTEGMGFWPAAIIMSLVFGGIHLGNRNEAITGALAAGAIGFFFCLTLRRTGTLWFAVGFHAAWDWGETYLYSVPDSGLSFPGQLMRPSFHGKDWLTGGPVGPEGSVLVFVAMVIVALLFHRFYREAKFPA
jgi:hypothetical protein